MLNRIRLASEVVRCATARHLFVYCRFTSHLSYRIAPKTHPWRILIESADADITALTDSTLRPRDASGAPRVVVRTRRSRIAPVVYAILFLYVLYSVLDDFVVELPKILSPVLSL